MTNYRNYRSRWMLRVTWSAHLFIGALFLLAGIATFRKGDDTIRLLPSGVIWAIAATIFLLLIIKALRMEGKLPRK